MKYTLKGIRPGYAVVCIKGVPVGHVEYVRVTNALLGNTGWHAYVKSRRVGPTWCPTRERAACAIAETVSATTRSQEMEATRS